VRCRSCQSRHRRRSRCARTRLACERVAGQPRCLRSSRASGSPAIGPTDTASSRSVGLAPADRSRSREPGCPGAGDEAHCHGHDGRPGTQQPHLLRPRHSHFYESSAVLFGVIRNVHDPPASTSAATSTNCMVVHFGVPDTVLAVVLRPVGVGSITALHDGLGTGGACGARLRRGDARGLEQRLAWLESGTHRLVDPAKAPSEVSRRHIILRHPPCIIGGKLPPGDRQIIRCDPSSPPVPS